MVSEIKTRQNFLGTRPLLANATAPQIFNESPTTPFSQIPNFNLRQNPGSLVRANGSLSPNLVDHEKIS